MADTSSSTQQPSTTAASTSGGGTEGRKQPLVIIVVGMAGTGKTTLVHRLQHYACEKNLSSYFINLDPAVVDTPYDVNIDIRDTVKYKEVLEQYKLGPNGGIMTTLNLYATKFHQVINILERKQETLDWIIVDTPGQIEVFTWSASGQLITEALSSTFPTIMLFVADTTRCTNSQTFMSTMLYSSSIMFKSQLPLVVAFNKVDVADCQFALEWMKDPDALSEATRGQKSYSATLTQSLSLFVHEFYEHMKAVGVSAATGEGMDSLRDAFEAARQEYETEFMPMVKERAQKREKEDRERVERQMAALKVDRERKQ